MVILEATTPQLKVIKDLADSLASRDVKSTVRLLSKDFTLSTFPKVAELPVLTGEGYLQKYGPVLGAFAKIEITFHDVIDAPGKAVTHHLFTLTTVDGTRLDYEGVSIFSFVDEDGEPKILSAKEFTDPQKRGEFFSEAAKALGKGEIVA